MKLPRTIVVFFFAVPWVAALCGLAWLLVLRFPPSGVFTAESQMNGNSPWINPFLPAERTAKPTAQDGWVGQRLIDDPTYFTARVPGPYETVEVTLEYQALRQPLLEFGLVRDVAGKELELLPLYSSELGSGDWQPASGGGRMGFVNGVPASRLANPDTRGLATWDATATMPVLQDPSSVAQSMAVSFRGSHDFYLVPTADGVDFTLTLQDANRTRGNDVGVIRVTRDDQEILSDVFGASGSRETKMGKAFERTVHIPDAGPGVYRVAFTADDDVFIRNIRTTSRRMVIGPRLVFGDVVGYSTSTYEAHVWTNSRHIVAETFHTEGFQRVGFGSVSAPINRTHTSVRMDRTDDSSKPVLLTAPRGDIRFIGDGYFSLSEDAFFEPKPRRLTDGTRLAQEHIQAVATPYVKPTDLGGGWLRSTFRFTLNPSMDTLRFVLSAPGVASRSGAVDVRRVQLVYRRDAITLSDWWRVLRLELANAWRRL